MPGNVTQTARVTGKTIAVTLWLSHFRHTRPGRAFEPWLRRRKRGVTSPGCASGAATSVELPQGAYSLEGGCQMSELGYLPSAICLPPSSFLVRRSNKCLFTSGHSAANTLYMTESRTVPSRRAW